MTVRRSMARLLVVVGGLAGAGLAGTGVLAPPAAAAQGVTVRITEAPDRFAAGGAPATLTVVASKRAGDCVKVRWSLVVRLSGAAAEQLRVDRIEQDGSFPMSVRAGADTARFTDRRLDPGTLCRGRTVTARYEVSFAEQASNARAVFQAEAYGADGRLLARVAATRAVVGDRQPSASPSPSEAGPPPAQPDAAAVDPAAATPRSSSIRVLPVGLAVGGVLLSLGLGLLLKARRKLTSPAGR